MQIGYARVSTEDQNLALQVDALEYARCDQIFFDKAVSGVAVSRPALDQVLSTLKSGDVLVTWKLDRLGRSLEHLIDLMNLLAAREIGFRSLCEAIDTTTSGGKLLFHIMGALAEFERTLISERTRAGMASAKARGIRLGRPRKLAVSAVREAKLAIDAGTAGLPEMATALSVAPITLARALKEMTEAV